LDFLCSSICFSYFSFNILISSSYFFTLFLSIASPLFTHISCFYFKCLVSTSRSFNYLSNFTILSSCLRMVNYLVEASFWLWDCSFSCDFTSFLCFSSKDFWFWDCSFSCDFTSFFFSFSWLLLRFYTAFTEADC